MTRDDNLIATDDDGGNLLYSRLIVDLDPGAYLLGVRGWMGRSGPFAVEATVSELRRTSTGGVPDLNPRGRPESSTLGAYQAPNAASNPADSRRDRSFDVVQLLQAEQPDAETGIAFAFVAHQGTPAAI